MQPYALDCFYSKIDFDFLLDSSQFNKFFIKSIFAKRLANPNCNKI